MLARETSLLSGTGGVPLTRLTWPPAATRDCETMANPTLRRSIAVNRTNYNSSITTNMFIMTYEPGVNFGSLGRVHSSIPGMIRDSAVRTKHRCRAYESEVPLLFISELGHNSYSYTRVLRVFLTGERLLVQDPRRIQSRRKPGVVLLPQLCRTARQRYEQQELDKICLLCGGRMRVAFLFPSSWFAISPPQIKGSAV